MDMYLDQFPYWVNLKEERCTYVSLQNVIPWYKIDGIITDHLTLRKIIHTTDNFQIFAS